MDRLKIFSVSEYDWAGCGYFLAQAIQKKTPHKCRAVRLQTPKLDFPFDMLDIGDRNINKLIRWCDVIHIHDSFNHGPFDKPVMITFHGDRYRKKHEGFHKMLEERGWFGTVATTDLTRFGLLFMPDCRPDLRKYYDPPDKFTVAHAPTNRKYKGTERVIEACKRLDIPLVLVENTPWKECLEIKGRAHVLVDQFELGYGCNAIEAWSMGMPVVSDAFGEVEAAMLDIFGYCPYVKAGDDLEGTLDRLKWSRSWRKDWAATGHAHYLEWHSYEAVAQTALQFYAEMVK